MPNAIAHQKAGDFMHIQRTSENHKWVERLMSIYGPKTLLQLHETIAATRQIACKCLHEKTRAFYAEQCSWRKKNTRCTHQADMDNNIESVSAVYVAGAHVLRGLGQSSPALHRIIQPAAALSGLDGAIRTAYRIQLQDDPAFAEKTDDDLPECLRGAASVEELEALIEAARKPYADLLDAIGDELTEGFRLALEIEQGWRPEPELVQLGLAF